MVADPVFSACSWIGNTGTVADPYDHTDIADCITDASGKTGDVTISIPSCDVTWDAPVAVNMESGFANVTSITVSGAGTPPTTCDNATAAGFSIPSACGSAVSGGTKITMSGAGFRMTGAAGKKWRITNLFLSGSAATNYSIITALGTSKPSDGGGWRVDHVTSRDITSKFIHSSYVGNTSGVVHNIDNRNSGQFSNWAHLTYGGNTLWSNDPIQQDMIFIEDSFFEDTTPTVPSMLADGSYGASIVVRYNAIKGYYVGGHDASSDARGIRRYEVYGNEFYNAGSNGAIHAAFALRGGDGYIYENKMTFPGSNPFSACTVLQGGHGICLANYRSLAGIDWSLWPAEQFRSYCDSSEEYMCVGSYWSNSVCDPESASACNNVQVDCQAVDNATASNGYPCRDQIGRGTNQKSSPMLFWGNTASINGGDYEYAEATVRQDDNVTLHVVAGRDFCTAESVMPATCNDVTTIYTPYAYPHPLRGSATNLLRGRVTGNLSGSVK